MIVASALLCLAANLYNEARGEPVMGQYAVAMVTMNRAGNDPEKVCATVFKRRQFSWTNNGYTKVRAGYELKPHVTPADEDAWKKALIIAKTTLDGRMGDFTRGADHYHATRVHPRWTASMVMQRRIGQHVFYSSAAQS